MQNVLLWTGQFDAHMNVTLFDAESSPLATVGPWCVCVCMYVYVYASTARSLMCVCVYVCMCMCMHQRHAV